MGILRLVERQKVPSAGISFPPQNSQLLLWDYYYFEDEISYDSTVNLVEPRKVVTFVYLGRFVCEVQF